MKSPRTWTRGKMKNEGGAVAHAVVVAVQQVQPAVAHLWQPALAAGSPDAVGIGDVLHVALPPSCAVAVGMGIAAVGIAEGAPRVGDEHVHGVVTAV